MWIALLSKFLNYPSRLYSPMSTYFLFCFLGLCSIREGGLIMWTVCLFSLLFTYQVLSKILSLAWTPLAINFSRTCRITVSNKNTHLADFETCVFRGYLRNHLSSKKVFLYLFASLSEEFSDKKKIICEIWSQNQLIFAKTLFCQKKVSYLKKSAILKFSKTLFHGSKV